MKMNEMISFDGMSYKKFVEIFNGVIDNFIPDNSITFKDQNNIIYSIKNDIRYRIIRYNHDFDTQGIRFSVRPKLYKINGHSRTENPTDWCNYDIVSDENKTIKLNQLHPPILQPIEFINNIIEQIGINELVIDQINKHLDSQTMIALV